MAGKAPDDPLPPQPPTTELPIVPLDLTTFQTKRTFLSDEIIEKLDIPPQDLLKFLEAQQEIQRGIRSQKLLKEENQEKRQEWTKRWAMGFGFGTAIAILIYAGITHDKAFPEKALIASISAFGGFAAGSLKKQSEEK